MTNLITVLKRFRTVSGLSQAELGKKMGLTRDFVARIENNLQKITAEVLNRYSSYFRVSTEDINALAAATDQPFRYLLRANQGDCFTQQLRSNFEEWYNRMEILATSVPLIHTLDLPETNKRNDPEGDTEISPEAMAVELRRMWRVGERPINDPVALIEAMGLFIKGADLGQGGLFAINGKKGPDGKYAIMINNNQAITIERKRFSIIHELYHILAHSGLYEENPAYCGYGKGKDQRESEADRFAGNFLVPQNELLKTIEIIRNKQKGDQLLWLLKGHFMVSYQTILYRLKEIGYLNEEQFGYIFRNLRNKFRKGEPFPLTTELKFSQEEDLLAEVESIRYYKFNESEQGEALPESYPEIDDFLKNVSRTYIGKDDLAGGKFSIAENMN